MSDILFKNARIIDPVRNIDTKGDLGVSEGRIADCGKLKNPEIIDLEGKVLICICFIDMVNDRLTKCLKTFVFGQNNRADSYDTEYTL